MYVQSFKYIYFNSEFEKIPPIKNHKSNSKNKQDLKSLTRIIQPWESLKITLRK